MIATFIDAIVIKCFANERHCFGVFELGQRCDECGVEMRLLSTVLTIKVILITIDQRGGGSVLVPRNSANIA